MRKITVLAIIMILIFAASCAKQEVKEEIKEEVKEEARTEVTPSPQPAPQESVVIESPPAQPPEPEVVDETLPETPPAPVDTAVIVEKTDMSPELRELLTLADQKVKSYKYLFSITADNKQPNTYFIKGNYIKVKLFELDPYVIDNYYDVVYLDTKNKKAFGFCENTKRCISRDVDNTKRVFNLSYEDYRVKTPYEYLKEITFAKIVGPEVVENRGTTKVRVTEGDFITEYWLDATYGIPRRIKTTQGEKVLKTYNFADMTFNTLKDGDVWRTQ